MRAPRLYLALFAVLWLWPATTIGQSSALMDAFNRYEELYAQGRFEEAFPIAEKALMLAEREFGPKHQNTAIFLVNSPLKKASLTGFHATAKHIAAKAVSPSSETMRTI